MIFTTKNPNLKQQKKFCFFFGGGGGGGGAEVSGNFFLLRIQI